MTASASAGSRDGSEKRAGRADAPVSAASPIRYSGWIGRLTRSGLYDRTIAVIAENRRAKLAFVLLVPLFWVVAFHAGPIYKMAEISILADYPVGNAGVRTYTLDQYELFFESSIYLVPFARSMILSAIVTAICLVVAYPVAYYIAKVVPPAFRTRALLLTLIPFWAGELIRTFSVLMLLANRGAVNVGLRELAVIERPLPLLYNNFSLLFGLVYLMILYMLLPLYSAIEKIPRQLFEAAADLGAGPVTRFRRVVLPLSRDGIASGCCLVYLTVLGVFTAPLMLSGPSNVIFPEIIANFFYSANAKWPAGAAFAVIMLVASLTTAALFMRVVSGRSVRLT